MSHTPRRRRPGRDYRPGHFHPRWACEQDGCHDSGDAPDDTAPGDVLAVLVAAYEEHVRTAHREPVPT